MIRKVSLFILTMLFSLKVSLAIDQGYTDFKSSVTFNNATLLKAYSPTTLSSTSVNNYNWGSKPVLRSSASFALSITGFSGGRDGMIFSIMNVSTNVITLAHSSTQSTSGNRIATDTGSNVSISTGDSRSLWYDTISSVWRIIR